MHESVASRFRPRGDVDHMKIDLEDWHNGWFEVSVALQPDEIDGLISRLRTIQADPDQHFHLENDYSGLGGVGKLTFCRQASDETSNAQLTSRAFLPGETVSKH